jgi:flagellar hook assembly protein FlgD
LFRRWVIGSAVTVSWDGRDQNGTALPSGMYFIRSEVGSQSEVRKVMLVR